MARAKRVMPVVTLGRNDQYPQARARAKRRVPVGTLKDLMRAARAGKLSPQVEAALFKAAYGKPAAASHDDCRCACHGLGKEDDCKSFECGLNPGRKSAAATAVPQTEEAAIRAQRHAVYGDPQENHANIAQVWTALLRSRFGFDRIPQLDERTAELMLAAFKVLRAARPVPEEPKAFENYMDSFPDAKNYLDFAKEAAEILNKARQ